MPDDSNLKCRDVFPASLGRSRVARVGGNRRAPVPPSRRVFLKSSASVLAAVAMPAVARVALAQDDSAACETTSHQLPVPNFRLRMHNIAGLRPHRKDCYRLEAEEVGDKFILFTTTVTAARASP